MQEGVEGIGRSSSVKEDESEAWCRESELYKTEPPLGSSLPTHLEGNGSAPTRSNSSVWSLPPFEYVCELSL